jgi:hypothetical protein
MKITNSDGLINLLRRVARMPQSYRRLVLCAPFISEEVLCRRIAPNGTVRVPTLIITRPETARQILVACRSLKGAVSIASIPNLHAKVYLACGMDGRDSIALIGSFNLTAAALRLNYEVGVCIQGSSPNLRRQIEELENRLLQQIGSESNGVNL